MNQSYSANPYHNRLAPEDAWRTTKGCANATAVSSTGETHSPSSDHYGPKSYFTHGWHFPESSTRADEVDCSDPEYAAFYKNLAAEKARKRMSKDGNKDRVSSTEGIHTLPANNLASDSNCIDMGSGSIYYEPIPQRANMEDFAFTDRARNGAKDIICDRHSSHPVSAMCQCAYSGSQAQPNPNDGTGLLRAYGSLGQNSRSNIYKAINTYDSRTNLHGNSTSPASNMIATSLSDKTCNLQHPSAGDTLPNNGYNVDPRPRFNSKAYSSSVGGSSSSFKTYPSPPSDVWSASVGDDRDGCSSSDDDDSDSQDSSSSSSSTSDSSHTSIADTLVNTPFGRALIDGVTVTGCGVTHHYGHHVSIMNCTVTSCNFTKSTLYGCRITDSHMKGCAVTNCTVVDSVVIGGFRRNCTWIRSTVF